MFGPAGSLKCQILAQNYNDTIHLPLQCNHPQTHMKKQTTKNNLTIYYKTKKHQSQVQLNTLSHETTAYRWCSSSPQLISWCLPSLSSSQSSHASQTHFCKKGKGLVNWVYKLLLYPSFSFCREWVWLARLVSILSSLVAVSLFSLFLAFHFAFVTLPLICILTLDWQTCSHPRITGTDHQHVCVLV